MPSARRTAPLAIALGLAGCLALGACKSSRKVVDPTLIIQGAGGVELGVSTDYGVVFLGRSTSAGDLDVTAWFGDGPSIETSAVEPVGGGLYTAEIEIRLPTVPITFTPPTSGTSVLIKGRRAWEDWETTARVRTDPRVEGLLLSVPRALRRAGPDQVGAGVYLEGPRKSLTLVGLVSGRLRLVTEEGEREYLTVVGPETLWRLVAHRRTAPTKHKWVYREDIL